MINEIIYKFYGSGIGCYFPFKQLLQIYNKIRDFFPIKKQTNDGFFMYLESGKFIDDVIMSTGQREPTITKLFKKHIQSGYTILDIGANIGYYSLLAAKLTGGSGKVIAFEPNTKNYQRLNNNMQLNNFQNLEIVKKGVGNKGGTLELFYDTENPGATSLVKRSNHVGGTELVDIIVLDEYTDISIDFIKLDIEGYEGEAIEGMRNILRNNNIKMIFEFSPVIYKSRGIDHILYCKNMLLGLKNIGYTLYHIHNNGSLENINNVDLYIDSINTLEVAQSDIFIMKE